MSMSNENSHIRLPGITTLIHSSHADSMTLPGLKIEEGNGSMTMTTIPRPPLSEPVRRPLAITSINAILNAPQAYNTSQQQVHIHTETKLAPRVLSPPILIPNTPRTHIHRQPIHTSHDACISNKRKTSSDTENPIPFSLESELHPDDDRLHNIDQDCDQIRQRINFLLNSGEMKVGEFIKSIGVNSKSYGSFMKLSGPYKGSSNGTYHNAFAFFKKREILGVKPVKKAKISREEELRILDVSSVKLDGEATMEVPVYDTCDEIRRKITEFLLEPGVTQAAFLREIAKSFPDGRNSPQSKVLKDFLNKKGARAGNTSAVFYGSYVFFEKMRIRDEKSKTTTREEMERIYENGDEDAEEGPSKRSKKGLDIKKASSGKVWCMKGDRVREDRYGRLSYY